MCGADEAQIVTVDARREYERLLPEMAAVEPGLLNGALLGTYDYLVYGKALLARGYAHEAIGGFFAAAFHAHLARFPGWFLRHAYRLAAPLVAARLRREASRHTRRGL